MITGIISFVAYILTMAKFITKRMGNHKIDIFAQKVHKIFSSVLIVSTIIHFILVWKLRYQRPIGMTISGLAMIICVVITLLSHIFAKHLGKRWLPIHRSASFLIAICLMVHIFLGISSFNSYQKTISSISFSEKIDMKDVADGIYVGDFDAGYIYAKVSITVSDNRIASASILEHRNEHGQPAEQIPSKIVENNTVYVDAISGATNSSKVIIKATENALRNQGAILYVPE